MFELFDGEYRKNWTKRWSRAGAAKRASMLLVDVGLPLLLVGGTAAASGYACAKSSAKPNPFTPSEPKPHTPRVDEELVYVIGRGARLGNGLPTMAEHNLALEYYRNHGHFPE